MRVLTERRCAAESSPALVVLLPPAMASVDDYYAQGFVQAWRERAVLADLQLADLDGQRVLNRTAVIDLHTQVVLPALASGYRSIWLVGISLGAYSALSYAAAHATSLQRSLAGLYLISPYPGTSDILAEIRSAGDLAAWSQQHPSQEDERAWWHWLSALGVADTARSAIYFGSGNSDRFRRGQALIAQNLAATQVRWAEGAHDWSTWKGLWETWLDRGPFGSETWDAAPTITGEPDLI